MTAFISIKPSATRLMFNIHLSVRESFSEGVFNILEVQAPLTWSNQRLSADGCDTAAHVYSSDFCDCRTVPLLSSVRGAVGGACLPSSRSLGPLAGVLEQ